MPRPKRLPQSSGGHIEHIAANPSAVGHARQKADVARQGAEIADVIGDPLQFQCDAAEELSAGGNAGPCDRLDRAAIGGRMATVLSPASVSA